MPHPDFSYPIREPTGLGLGTFDVYLIRQKLYEGEFHARCEFQTADGDWHPVSDHPAFAVVLWLVDGHAKPKAKGRVTRRAISQGWKVQGQAEKKTGTGSVRLSGPARPARVKPAKEEKSGLLGRFFGGKK